MREYMREFERQLNQTMTVREAAEAVGAAEKRAAKAAEGKIVAFLRCEEEKHAKEAAAAVARGAMDARDRLVAKASVLRTMIAYIERGDHLTGDGT